MDNLWVAFILSIVEGLTEYLPVSSSGHLVLVGDLLNFSGEKAATFQVVIQLGAIMAVVVLYWGRLLGPAAAATGRALCRSARHLDALPHLRARLCAGPVAALPD